MADRVYNFSPGPAAMPLSVLKQAQQDLLAYPGAGASVLEISHRSATFSAILEEAELNLRQLLAVPDDYSVLFLQGGARLQFSMVPMNLLRGSGRAAAYVLTGSWTKKAVAEARKEGETAVVWSDESDDFRRVPGDGELEVPADAAYLYFTSNETIQGVQFPQPPQAGDVPLVCDASSDFLSRPLQVERYGLIFACAQKNAGAAGLTLVIVRNDLLDRVPDNLPSMLDMRQLVAANSLLNTPPVFAIYLFMLVSRWLRQEGGLAKLEQRNRRKSEILYGMLDEGDFYSGHAERASRSYMNVTFRLPSETLEKEFLAEAQKRGLCELKGHRSVGGIRASIYNAMPLEGVESLRHFMLDFARRKNKPS